VTICTEAFIGLAREESKNLGMPDLPLAIIKHPIGGESLAVIHQRADDAPRAGHSRPDGATPRPVRPAPRRARRRRRAKRFAFANEDKPSKPSTRVG
jgi:hypothetical protein